MPNKKRKATSAAKEPVSKQQKLAPTKKEKAGGWLLEVVKQQRTENKEMNTKRLRFISDTQKIKQGSEGVLYWMLRDHRVQGECSDVQVQPVFSVSVCSDRFCVLDNWALIHAQQLALKDKLPLHVCVCLHVPKSELSTLRHYSFMLRGLEEVAKVSKDCAEKTSFNVCVPSFCLCQTGMQSLRYPVPPATRVCGEAPSRVCFGASAGSRGDRLLPPQRAAEVVGGCQEEASKVYSPHTGEQFCCLDVKLVGFLHFSFPKS